VGIGEPVVRTAPAVLILPWGASGAADRVWRYDRATGTWVGVTPPQAGWYWYGCAANPFNANEWLLFGNTVSTGRWRYDTVGGPIKPWTGSAAILYHTADQGATWTPITVTGDTITPAFNATWGSGFPYVTWRSDGLWATSGGITDTGIATGRLWVGSGASVVQAVTTTDHAPIKLAATTGGRMVYIQAGPFTGSDNQWYGLAEADLSLSAPGGTTPKINRFVEALPGGAGVVLMNTNGNVYAGALNAAPTLRVGLGTNLRGTAAAAADHGVYAPRNGGGMFRITDILGTPAATVVANAASNYDAVRSSRLDRTRVVTLDRAAGQIAITWTDDGVTWADFLGPTGMTSSNTATWLELLEDPL
jgi:hypothetical protein